MARARVLDYPAVRKLAFSAGLALIFLAIFLTLNYLHFRFLPVKVVMYDAFLDVLLTLLIMGGAAWALSKRINTLTAHEITLTLAIGVLGCALYAVVVPTVIDRSLSIYILEKLEQRGGGIRQDAFPSVFTQEYLPEHHLTDIRLTEQLNSGTVKIVDGCVVLTPRGKRVIAFTKFYRGHLLPRHREILGAYSDTLTDPFRNSVREVGYRCRPPAGK